jgi:hypothetical protein
VVEWQHEALPETQMTWFAIAVLVALGGIFVAWKRGKDMPVVVPKNLIDPDAPRINVNDPKDVERWTKELKVDTYDLKGAVQDVGANADKVRKELRDK